MQSAKPSKEYVAAVLARLDAEYGTDDIIYLTHEEPWQLLIAVILSAQCTDARVNMVTPGLFRQFPSVEAFAEADIPALEEAIHSIGFYHSKAKNIKACCRRLHDVYQDRVPDTMDELLTLPGVGRKTANVILGNVYRKPSVVVDTHVGRISRKLGFTAETDPEKVEYELMEILPEDHWILVNMHLITLGRTICFARKPHCSACFLKDLCPSAEAK
ncbi:MAG: endonuclease III [Lachnospiraceae bacterium]|nr:endonuclease III [Lachnospiraceae bacterium]MBQ7601256.1 endonuclease III [Lachnospiraceae bacterium]